MKTKNIKNNYSLLRYGFSLLEILVVCTLIASTLITILINWRTSRSNQALKTSAEIFSNHIRSAHIYAREAKNSRSWGVRQTDQGSYQLISGEESSPIVESQLSLESQINFKSLDFILWFDIGTGETKNNQSIELENMIGKKIKVDIYKTGLVEMSGIY